jgi:hypothetical protein
MEMQEGKHDLKAKKERSMKEAGEDGQGVQERYWGGGLHVRKRGRNKDKGIKRKGTEGEEE